MPPERIQYVLRDATAEDKRYFVRMVAIGPMNGSLAEARRWERAEDAMRSPAWAFPWTVYRVEEVADAP